MVVGYQLRVMAASDKIIRRAGSFALRKLRIDDPTDAIPVHAGAAIFGLLSVAFCTPSFCNSSGSGGMTHPFCAETHTVGHWLAVLALGRERGQEPGVAL
eukprot:Skav205825  [mRNA]  locus=scaffold870:66692:69906:+ [translate_table: standard]